MKRFLLLLVCLLPLLAAPLSAQEESEDSVELLLDVYILDNDGSPYTNLRDAPRGNIVLQLPNGTYALYLSEFRNGWWKVEDIWEADADYDEDGNSLGITLDEEKSYWVHYSVIASGTRNYGGQRLCLRQKPSAKARPTYWFKTEINLRPIEIDPTGNWVKVKTVDGKHTGWIELEMLCGNPVTNCC